VATNTTEPQKTPEPLAVSQRQAAAHLGIGITKLRELIADGELDTLPIGRRRPVVYSSLVAYVDRQRQRGRHAS
jgi:hypothetical protein